jgi:hypothetical protein
MGSADPVAYQRAQREALEELMLALERLDQVSACQTEIDRIVELAAMYASRGRGAEDEASPKQTPQP